MVLFGFDMTSPPPPIQFFICASGVFAFTIIYGYLQELLAVHIAGRKYALFLATVQFAGYAFWSAILSRLRGKSGCGVVDEGTLGQEITASSQGQVSKGQLAIPSTSCQVPFRVYVGLSIVRSIDLGMTNLAMQFLNYPAKTLIKSSRVAFTMLLGIAIGRKKYKTTDYGAVGLLVVGLGVFLHADSTGDAVFHPLGVMMLVHCFL